MSRCYDVENAGFPIPEKILAELNDPEIRMEKYDKGVRFYHDGLSFRGVEINDEDGKTEVRIAVLASEKDFALCGRILSILSCNGKKNITCDCDDGFVDLAYEFSPEHILELRTSDVDMINTFVTRVQNEGVKFPGIKRVTHIGIHTIEKYHETASDRTLLSFITDVMHETQYSQWPDYYESSTMLIKASRPIPMKSMCKGDALFLHNYDYLLISRDENPSADPDSMAIIKPHEFYEIAPKSYRFLDDSMCLVEPVSDSEWNEFFKKARSMTHDLKKELD